MYGFDMSCIRKLATQEPLVDVVNPDQVVSSYSPIFVRLSLYSWRGSEIEAGERHTFHK